MIITCIDLDGNLLRHIVNGVFRREALAAFLLREHLFYAVSYGINHVETNHPLTKAVVAIVLLRTSILQNVLNSARQEKTTVGECEKTRFFYQYYPLLQRIILMCQTIMEQLTYAVVIILLFYGLGRELPLSAFF